MPTRTNKHATPQQMTHGRAVKEICGMLQRCFDVATPVEVFRSFIEACHIVLDTLPAHVHYALTQESIMPADAQARWLAATQRFSPQTLEAFAQGFAVLLMACDRDTMTQTDSGGGPDVLGSVYMNLLEGKNRWNYRAQYFTPWNIAYMMAQMSGASGLEARFHAEVKTHLHDDPIIEALTLTASVMGQDLMAHENTFVWWLSKAWPSLKPKIEPVTIMDPCVGSGIMLLAQAACHPAWLSAIGYVHYYGMDLDPLCVEMCRLNLRLYGITPMRLEPVTLEALEKHRALAGPWADAYETAISAPLVEQPAAHAAVIEQITAARLEQLSLF